MERKQEPGQYVYVSRDIIESKLSSNAKILYIYLVSKSTDGKKASVSRKTIKAGINFQTLDPVIKELENENYILVDSGNVERSNIYTFCITDSSKNVKVSIDFLSIKDIKKEGMNLNRKLAYIIIDNAKVLFGSDETSQKDLEEYTNLSESTVKRVCEDLCENDWIERISYAQNNCRYKLMEEKQETSSEKSNEFPPLSKEQQKKLFEKVTKIMGKSFFESEVSCVASAAKTIRKTIVDNRCGKIHDIALYSLYCEDEDIRFSYLIRDFINNAQKNASFLYEQKEQIKKYYKNKEFEFSDELLDEDLNWSKQNDSISIQATFIKRGRKTNTRQFKNNHCPTEIFEADSPLKFVENASYHLILRISYDKRQKTKYTVLNAVSQNIPTPYTVTEKKDSNKVICFIQESKYCSSLKSQKASSLDPENLSHAMTCFQPEKKGIISKAVSLINAHGLTIPFHSMVKLNISDNYSLMENTAFSFSNCCIFENYLYGYLINASCPVYLLDTEKRFSNFLTQMTDLSLEQIKIISQNYDKFHLDQNNFDFNELSHICHEKIVNKIKMASSPESLQQFNEKDPTLFKKVYYKYGLDSMHIIRKNPYVLLDFDQKFAFCDKIARNSNISYNAYVRSKVIMKYLLDQQNQQGEIVIFNDQIEDILVRCQSELGDSYPQRLTANELIKAAKVSRKFFVTPEYITFREIERYENSIVENIKRLNSQTLPSFSITDEIIGKAFKKLSIEPENEKIQALKLIESHGISIVTGKAGTGKSTVIKLLTEISDILHKKIALCAPTGKAANNISFNKHNACTIHKLLTRNKEEPFFNYDLIIVDEASMLDLKLASDFFKKVKDGTRVLLMGDKNQLPPVEVGQFFEDLIKSACLPTVELTKVFRQNSDSSIYKNAQNIINGKDLQEDDDFHIIECKNDDEIYKAVRTKIKENLKYSIIIPVKKEVNKINKMIQNIINTSKSEVGTEKRKYRQNDIVIFLKNGVSDSDKHIPYFNGQTGVISSIDESKKTLTIKTDNRDEPILLSMEHFCNIALGYSFTIHKSQGSQFDNVIICLPERGDMLITRKLLYTAVTRAKKSVIIYTLPGKLEKAISNAHEVFSPLEKKLKNQIKGD